MNRYLSRVSLAAVVMAAFASMCTAEDSEQVPHVQRLPLVKYVEPSYPARMRFNGVTSGDVTVWMTVDRAGRLVDAYATEFSHESFAKAAIAAIEKWEFEPDPGAFVPRLYPVKFSFMLEGTVVVVMHPDNRRLAMDPFVMPASEHKSYPFAALDTLPAALHTPLPAYPDELKPEKKSGRVEVLFFVDRAGRVRVPSIVQSDDPHFSEAVIDAVKNWSFEVPKRRGHAVSAFSVHSFTFGPRDSSNG